MNNQYAIVTNGIVTNVIGWNGGAGWAPPAGSTANLVPADVAADIGYTFNGANYAPPAPPTISLTAARATQSSILSAMAQAAIIAGFMSSALGAPHNYGSQITDQLNLAAAVAGGAGGSLWCASGTPAVWALAAHTASQVAQLNTDWLAFRAGLQSKYAGLLAQVAAATTPAAVQAIVWG